MLPMFLMFLAALAGNGRAETPLNITAGKGGFQFSSPDGDFVLKIRGMIQADGRFFLQDQPLAIDTFTMRRIRPIIEGTVFNIFDFRFTPDFGGGTTVIQDAYLDARFHPAAKVRFGKAKAPFGLERLQSAADIEFVERSLATFLVPNRDLGIQLFGDFAGGKISYAAAIMNGVVDGGSSDTDVGNGKDFVSRIFMQPIDGLGVGFAVSTGEEKGNLVNPALPNYKTSGQQTFFRYRASITLLPDTVLGDGRRTRYSPQAYFYRGPVGFLGEYVFSSQEVHRDVVTTTLDNKAFNLNATFVLTGEPAGYKGIVPNKSFGSEGGLGAFELALRYSELDVDNDAFPLFADPLLFSTKAKNWTIGLNWYLNKNVKFVFDYDQTNFDGGALKTEKLFLTRFQINL
jgi:phosphate-selective porin OprO and OprP